MVRCDDGAVSRMKHESLRARTKLNTTKCQKGMSRSLKSRAQCPCLYCQSTKREERKRRGEIHFVIQKPESQMHGSARKCCKNSHENRTTIKTANSLRKKTPSGGTPCHHLRHLTPTRQSPSEASPWLTPCPWQRRSALSREDVIGWDTMPFPAPSDSDSSISLASFTTADTVSFATTLRTVVQRRHLVGHRAVTCAL